VLTAINFNNNFAIATDKIRYVRSYRILPHELESAQSPIAQAEPQFHFSVG
jgi:hypothetical protein